MARHFDSSLIAFWLVFSVLSSSGCGSIEPDPPVDEDGNLIPLPRPLERWLRFIDITPTKELSLRPTIKLTFNAYLDTTTFNSYSAVQLASGGFTYAGQVDYWMTQKALYFRPNAELEPDLLYELRLPGGRNLRSVTGSPLHPELVLPRMHARQEQEQMPAVKRPTVPWEKVEAIFEASCNSCHNDPSWGLPNLTPQGLVGTPSEQVDLAIVEPFHPAQSYLMHKILPDYPQRRFTLQPPPWSAEEPLTQEELELIEHWIAQGAPGPS